MSIAGIDCSSWQGSSIDWTAVAAAGYDFCIIKATQGTGYINPTFASDWSGTQAAGLVRGAYHYAEPDNNHPESEADFFLGVVRDTGGFQPGDFAMLDVEQGSGDLLAWVLQWLVAVESALGFKPMLYSRTEFMTAHNLLDSQISDNGLVLAQFQPVMPMAPKPWQFIAIWQSGTQPVAGIPGLVDVDTFFGSREQLQAYGLRKSDMPLLDDAARLKLIGYTAGGSGVKDLTSYLAGYRDPV